MAGIKRKQSKNTYKIPRSLKQSIKQNLNKIVKRRERKLRDEEGQDISLEIENRLFEAHSYCTALDNLIQNFDMSRELAHALDALLFRHWDDANAAVGRQRAATKEKKAYTRQAQSKGSVTHEIEEDMMLWKVEGQDEERDEDMDTADGDEDEEDWSSTSTLGRWPMQKQQRRTTQMETEGAGMRAIYGRRLAREQAFLHASTPGKQPAEQIWKCLIPSIL